ncbi:MAG TPA: hypothetical protein DCM40_08725 [Maribacter sp.]|nr:hypothetical protein [Maribacter sp.]
MLDKWNPFKKKQEPKRTNTKKRKSEKDLATEAGEPWVSVLGMELDEGSLERGAFELDWNDLFVAKLIRAGYQGKTDNGIVDNWFQDVCRNIVMETLEKEQAMTNVENLDEHRNAYK